MHMVGQPKLLPVVNFHSPIKLALLEGVVSKPAVICCFHQWGNLIKKCACGSKTWWKNNVVCLCTLKYVWINLCFLSCAVPECKWHWSDCAAFKMKIKSKIKIKRCVPYYNSELILNCSLMFLICGIVHCRLESMPGSSSTEPRRSWRAPPGPRPGCPGRSCRGRWPAAPLPSASSCARQNWWESAQTSSQWILQIPVPVLMEGENINNQLSLLTLWIITLVRMKMAYFAQWKGITLLHCAVLFHLAFYFCCIELFIVDKCGLWLHFRSGVLLLGVCLHRKCFF